MQFTDDEEKMVNWLRRQHSGWRTTRVIILTSSLICIWFAAREFMFAGWGAVPLLLLFIGAYGSSYSLGSWSGRPEVSLLLKLIERETDDKNA